MFVAAPSLVTKEHGQPGKQKSDHPVGQRKFLPQHLDPLLVQHQRSKCHQGTGNGGNKNIQRDRLPVIGAYTVAFLQVFRLRVAETPFLLPLPDDPVQKLTVSFIYFDHG